MKCVLKLQDLQMFGLKLNKYEVVGRGRETHNKWAKIKGKTVFHSDSHFIWHKINLHMTISWNVNITSTLSNKALMCIFIIVVFYLNVISFKLQLQAPTFTLEALSTTMT